MMTRKSFFARKAAEPASLIALSWLFSTTSALVTAWPGCSDGPRSSRTLLVQGCSRPLLLARSYWKLLAALTVNGATETTIAMRYLL